jgi:hypothetical protein
MKNKVKKIIFGIEEGSKLAVLIKNVIKKTSKLKIYIKDMELSNRKKVGSQL